MDACKFQIGQIVYAVLNSEKRGMVTGITFCPEHIVYLVTWAETGNELNHFAMELTSEQTFTSPDGTEAHA